MAIGSLIETRSIDYVPLAERHGKVWHLWPVWFSGDAHLATLAVGAVGISLGGNLLWTSVACSAPSSWPSTRPRGRSSVCRR
jgi:NCS1 family nucleobase:cation symporter-1